MQTLWSAVILHEIEPTCSKVSCLKFEISSIKTSLAVQLTLYNTEIIIKLNFWKALEQTILEQLV